MKPKPKPCSANPGHVGPPENIRLRRLQAGDCLEHLTGMLHRAFSRLGEMGIACSCVSQTAEVTRQRVERGDCFVALNGERIVGTITLYAADATSESRCYRDARVASVRQLGVDPRFQGKGVGTALLHLAQHWARQRGYTRLVLDTPESAGHLIDYYHRQGFCIVETLRFSARPYRSVVFAKSLRHPAARRPLSSLSKRHAFAAVPTLCRHILPPAGTAGRTGAAYGCQRSRRKLISTYAPRNRR